MTEKSNGRPEPMPAATCCLICEECAATIVEMSLCTERLASALFKARKDHAKKMHGWEERLNE